MDRLIAQVALSSSWATSLKLIVDALCGRLAGGQREKSDFHRQARVAAPRIRGRVVHRERERISDAPTHFVPAITDGTDAFEYVAEVLGVDFSTSLNLSSASSIAKALTLARMIEHIKRADAGLVAVHSLA